MTISDLFTLGLASAPFVIGLATVGQGHFGPEPESEEEKERRELRERRGVRPIQVDEEAAPLNQCPAGVYGFTSSPATAAVPLYARRTYRSFEVHRLTDGTAHYVGYVTADAARTIEEGKTTIDIRLYPDPYEDSTTLVSVAQSRIGRMKGPSRDDGNWVDFEVFADK